MQCFIYVLEREKLTELQQHHSNTKLSVTVQSNDLLQEHYTPVLSDLRLKKKRKEIKHFWIRELTVHNTTSFLIDTELSINFKNRATGFLFLQEKLNTRTEHAALPI